MGKYRFLHGSLGLVHDTHRTPHRAILLCGVLLALCIVAPMDLRKSGAMKTRHVLLGSPTARGSPC